MKETSLSYLLFLCSIPLLLWQICRELFLCTQYEKKVCIVTLLLLCHAHSDLYYSSLFKIRVLELYSYGENQTMNIEYGYCSWIMNFIQRFRKKHFEFLCSQNILSHMDINTLIRIQCFQFDNSLFLVCLLCCSANILKAYICLSLKQVKTHLESKKV